MSNQVILSTGTILNGTWKLDKVLGQGACATVYAVTSVNPKIAASHVDYSVVAKVISLRPPRGVKKKDQEIIANTLHYEYTLMTGLLYGFPSCCRVPMSFYGDDASQQVRYLVMERLDCDLTGWVKENGRSITPAIIGKMGLQMLEGLQWLHKKRFVFVDVKPENFMMRGDKLHFVDFGLVERVTNSQLPRQFQGTPIFCSLRAHNCLGPTFHDDLEAMAYVLLSLFCDCKLPWSSATSDANLQRDKAHCNLKLLAESCGCDELWTIIEACRNEATATSTPDYDLFKSLLQSMSARGSIPTLSDDVDSPKTKKPAAKKAPASTKKTTAKASDLDITTSVPEPPSVDTLTPTRKRKASPASSMKAEELVQVTIDEPETPKKPNTRRKERLPPIRPNVQKAYNHFHEPIGTKKPNTSRDDDHYIDGPFSSST